MRRKHWDNVVIDFGDFEVTKQELILSIAIFMVMMLFGGLISQKISNHIDDKNAIYNKAAQITQSDIFDYSMRTNVGNAFVYGDLKTVDPVTFSEIGGRYLYVKKVKERYTMHTRVVTRTRTVNGKTQSYTTTEVYWTWDAVARWEKNAKKVTFLDIPFGVGKFSYPSETYIKTIQESGSIRYQYYAIDAEMTGTIFATLRDSTIPNETKFYRDCDIETALKNLQSNWSLFFFWFGWIVLTGGVIFAFYYIDNRWLE